MSLQPRPARQRASPPGVQPVETDGLRRIMSGLAGIPSQPTTPPVLQEEARPNRTRRIEKGPRKLMVPIAGRAPIRYLAGSMPYFCVSDP
jgi:hypothetical protein